MRSFVVTVRVVLIYAVPSHIAVSTAVSFATPRTNGVVFFTVLNSDLAKPATTPAALSSPRYTRFAAISASTFDSALLAAAKTVFWNARFCSAWAMPAAKLVLYRFSFA